MILLPSRGRPASILRFLEGYQATRAVAPVAVLVNGQELHDQGDAYEPVYRALPANWTMIPCRADTLGGKLNEALPLVLRDAPTYIGYVQDDLVPRTPHWDNHAIHAVHNSAPFITLSDAWRAEKKFTGAFFWDAALIKKLGYLFPPSLPHLFADDAWATLAGEIPCFWSHENDIVLEHLHAWRIGAEDATTRSIYNNERWCEAWIAWSAWLVKERPVAAVLCREALDEWRKRRGRAE